jgi:hypothetical protein
VQEFAGAISKTAAGGEIDALDPAGYGAVTITKGIQSTAAVDKWRAFWCQAPTLSWSKLDQLMSSHCAICGSTASPGVGGLNGIRYLSGAALHVESCDIFEFTGDGINVATSTAAALFVTDTFHQ